MHRADLRINMRRLSLHSSHAAAQQQQLCSTLHSKQPSAALRCWQRQQLQQHKHLTRSTTQQQQHLLQACRWSRRPAAAVRAEAAAPAAAAPSKVGARLGAAYSEESNMPDWHKGRRVGVVLHPTSLPGPNGIGELGAEAFRFIDWLEAAGMQCWQVGAVWCLVGHTSWMTAGKGKGAWVHCRFMHALGLTRRVWGAHCTCICGSTSQCCAAAQPWTCRQH
jgi:hypothetical protein